MNALLRDWRAIWFCSVSARHPLACMLATRVVPPVALLVAVLIGLYSANWMQALKVGVCMPLAALLWFWVFFFLPGAVLLNSPANARLVPRMRQRLIELAVLTWLVPTALLAATTGTGGRGIWVEFLVIGAWLIGAGIARGGRPAGAVIQMAIILAVLFRGALPPDVTGWLASDAGQGVLTLLVAALGAYALGELFPNGGDRHFETRKAQALSIERSSPQGRYRMGSTGRFGWGLYPAALRADCRRASAPRALLLHVLGPVCHWTVSCAPLLLVLALGCIAKGVLLVYASAATQESVAGFGWLMCIWLMLMQIPGMDTIVERIARTRGEQALLRLAPRIAGGAAFNRQLAHALVRKTLLDWATAAFTVMCLTALTGAGVDTLLMQASLCCLGLPMVAAALRDYARDPGTHGLVMVGWFILGALVSAAAALLASRVAGVSVWALLAPSCVVVAMVFATLRVRAMVAMPLAFPAGRLA
jgi:hypothetical protein